MTCKHNLPYLPFRDPLGNQTINHLGHRMFVSACCGFTTEEELAKRDAPKVAPKKIVTQRSGKGAKTQTDNSLSLEFE